MNRREFLKSLVVGAVGLSLDIDKVLEETAHLSDTDFVTFIKFQMNLYVDNPAHSVIITDIGVDE